MTPLELTRRIAQIRYIEAVNRYRVCALRWSLMCEAFGKDSLTAKRAARAVERADGWVKRAMRAIPKSKSS